MEKVKQTISIYASTRNWLKQLERTQDVNISRYVERLILDDKAIREGLK